MSDRAGPDSSDRGEDGPLVLLAARVITPHEVIRDGAVRIGGERLAAVGPRAVVPRLSARTIDLGDATILPGFIDLHIHGSGGDTAMDGSAAVARISRFIAAHGVTAWLPTLTPRATGVEMVEHIRAALTDNPPAALDSPLAGASAGPGAEVLGLHLEGPFLNPRRPGAIRSEWFHPPSIALLDRLLDAAEGRVRLMTLAPELPGGLDLVRRLKERGVVASIGHSDARGAEAFAAIDAGVTHATHLFNAMRPLHHRDPGVVGVAMAAPEVRAELIADGIHVGPTAARLLFAAKGAHGAIVITDAVAPAGCPDGVYEFDGRPIAVANGQATLGDGTIAGSVSTFDGNARWLVREVGVSLPDVARMSALTPARAIGLSHRKGALVPGYDADLVVLDPDLNVRLTIARGKIAFSRDEREKGRGDEETKGRSDEEAI